MARNRVQFQKGYSLVQFEVKSRVLDEGDTLPSLGSIAKTSVTNPNEFVLAGGC